MEESLERDAQFDWYMSEPEMTTIRALTCKWQGSPYSFAPRLTLDTCEELTELRLTLGRVFLVSFNVRVGAGLNITRLRNGLMMRNTPG